jgi:peroxiredoxin
MPVAGVITDAVSILKLPAASGTFVALQPGDPAPMFRQRSMARPSYAFDTAAGRYLVLCFFGSAAAPAGAAAISAALQRPDLFDDAHASFFGVSNDPADHAEGRLEEHYPGYRFLLDFDGRTQATNGGATTCSPIRP